MTDNIKKLEQEWFENPNRAGSEDPYTVDFGEMLRQSVEKHAAGTRPETHSPYTRWDLLSHHIGPATAMAGRTHRRHLLSWGEVVGFLLVMAAVGFAAAALGAS